MLLMLNQELKWKLDLPFAFEISCVLIEFDRLH